MSNRDLGQWLNAPATPFDYNPSSWSQRIPIVIIAFIGFLIAAYMGLYQWELIDSAWDPFFDGEEGSTKNGTEAVLTSDTSHQMYRWFHIPDAVFGAFAYLGDAVFGLAGSTRRWQCRPWLVILFGIDVIPLGVVSVILVVLQGTAVGYWCFLCLVTAVISLVLIAFAYDEVWSCIRYLHRVWKKSRDWGLLWRTFWGIPSPTAWEAGEELVAEARERASRKHRQQAEAKA